MSSFLRKRCIWIKKRKGLTNNITSGESFFSKDTFAYNEPCCSVLLGTAVYFKKRENEIWGSKSKRRYLVPDLKIEAPSCCHMPTQGYYTTHKKIIIKRKKKKTFFLSLSKYPYRPRLQFLIRAPVYNFYMMGSRSSSFPGPLSSQYWPGVYGRGE